MIYVIDHQDSFTFNLVHLLSSFDKVYVNNYFEINKKKLSTADLIVLSPGPGEPKDYPVTSKIYKSFKGKKKILGICLGFQLLFTESEEFNQNKGLGIIEGSVKSLSRKLNSVPVPHVGWNTVINQKFLNQQKFGPRSKIVLNDNDYYYFVHSYYVKPKNIENIYTVTRYGQHEFCSSIKLDNVFGCQFHPEKSGPGGLNFLKNYFS